MICTHSSVNAAAVEQAALGLHAAGQRAVVEAEEADQDGAGQTTDEVDADHVERVVEAEPELQADRQGSTGCRR